MRDAGLSRAIEAAGGISALARKLGVSQPSVSNWNRVPAERVLAVESVTQVPRSELRPDIYPAEGAAVVADPLEAMRARAYLILAGCLIRVPDYDLLRALAQVQGDETALGGALGRLGEAARVARHEDVAREYFDLFIGVGRGEMMPFASYYLTGFLYERPLVRIRQDLRRLGVERDAAVSEPEDHIGVLCEVMAGMAQGEFPAEPAFQRQFFERHLAPWASRFFGDLERADAARFYRAAGAFGRIFMETEREAFALEADEAGAPARESSDA